jgi:hypothetical protein
MYELQEFSEGTMTTRWSFEKIVYSSTKGAASYGFVAAMRAASGPLLLPSR